MTRISAIFVAIDIRKKTWSSSNDNWRLIVNVGGVDVLRELVRPVSHFGETIVYFTEELPAEGHAGIYEYGSLGVLHGSTVPASVDIDSTTLSASSLRLETLGADVIRAERAVAWGWTDDRRVVPLAAQSAPENLSTDPDEGFGSIPLGLADSGDDDTTFTECLLFVRRASGEYAGSRAPISLRFAWEDGTLADAVGLDGFERLEADARHRGDLWHLTGLSPLSRRSAHGALAPMLRADGADNAQVSRVVAFGVARGGPQPLLVPLIDLMDEELPSGGWFGPNDGGDRDLRLPLCQTAPRQ